MVELKTVKEMKIVKEVKMVKEEKILLVLAQLTPRKRGIPPS